MRQPTRRSVLGGAGAIATAAATVLVGTASPALA